MQRVISKFIKNSNSEMSEDEFMNTLVTLAMLAYEDQCSPANPRVPMVEDMKEIMKKAYKGN